MDLDNLDAPQFVDFTKPLSDSEEDNYFDYDHEKGRKRVINLVNTLHTDPFIESSDSFYDANEIQDEFPVTEDGLVETQEDTQQAPKTKTPQNLCTDLNEWRKKTQCQKVAETQAVRRSPRISKNTTENKSSSIPVTQKKLDSNEEASAHSKAPTKRPSTSDTDAANKRGRSVSTALAYSSDVRNKSQNNTPTNTSAEKKKEDVAKRPLARSGSLRLRSTASTASDDSHTSAPCGALRRSGSMRQPSCDRNNSQLSASGNESGLKRSGSMRRLPSHNRSASKEVKLTKPKTPEVAKRATSTSTKTLTTTDMELRKIEDFKKQLAAKRKLHEHYRLKAMAATAVVPKHETKPLTRPEEFHFKTDERIKNDAASDSQSENAKGVDFTRTLRSQAGSPKPSAIPQRTKVQPFSFDRKRKRTPEDGAVESVANGQYKSTAELVQKFSSHTPERFHTRGTKKEPSPCKRRRRSLSQPQLTLPKTPNLQTRNRSRPAHIKTYEELEAEEYEEHLKQQFKAHPVNEKILEPGYKGVKKTVPIKPLTEPCTPQLELRRRAATWKEKHQHEDEETYEFHANPVPKAILEGPVGVKPAKQIPLTVPSSPAFALRNRVASIVKDDNLTESTDERSLRTKAPPKFGVPFKPKLETKVTEPKPFSFDERMRLEQQRKEQKLQKIVEEQSQVKEFHAQPIPNLSPELPPKQVKQITVPQPFNLESDARGQARAEEWTSKIKEEMKTAREMATFKAKQSTVLSKEPFIPKRSSKPLTEVNDVLLNTEKRIGERTQWEKWRQEREQELQEIENARQRQKEEEEREMERQQRKQAVPKAQPIRRYKEVSIHPSDKPLTQPESPAFSDRTLRRSMLGH